MNSWILFDFRKRLGLLFRPRIDGAHVLLEEGHGRIYIFLGLCGAVRLMLPDSLNELFRKAGEEEIHSLGKECDGGRGVGDDKPFESLRYAGGGIFSCQHT